MEKNYTKPIFEFVSLDEPNSKFFAASANDQLVVTVGLMNRVDVEL